MNVRRVAEVETTVAVVGVGGEAVDGIGLAGAAGAAAAGVASAPHWALRKSFHFWPFRVPADLAA